MAKQHKYIPGNVAYYGETVQAEVEWGITNGEFSLTAGLYSKRRHDFVTCGAGVIQEIAELFPNDAKVQRMAAIAKEWHLNHMNAGSPSQTAFLKANPVTDRLNYYVKACEALAAAGLHPDPNFLYKGQPYRYGSAWLKVELPEDVLTEIEGWSK